MKNILLTLLLQSLIISGCNQTQNRDNQTSGSLVNKTEHIDSSNSINKTDIISNSTQAADNTIPTEQIISRTPLPPDTKFKILPVGVINEGIPSDTKNLEWLALSQDGSKSYLKKVTPKLKESDPSNIAVDFVEVSVQNNHQCVLLINANGLEEGEVPSFKVEKSKLLPGDTLSFRYNSDLVKLYVTGSLRIPGGSSFMDTTDNYKMTISQKEGVITQDIFNYSKYPTSNSLLPSIIWAGDIDADGKLDLIIKETDDRYGYSKIELFLSNIIDNSELLKSAAVFEILGC